MTCERQPQRVPTEPTDCEKELQKSSLFGAWPGGLREALTIINLQINLFITHSGYGTTPVGWGGGNRYVEGDLLTFGYLMLNDSLGYPYYRLINVG